MTVKYEKIDKNKIKTRSKPQARQTFDQSALKELADSLVTGQLQPIGVLSDYTLIWGERRLRAALLKKEITHLWAAVFDQEVSESEFLLMRATENFQRADLTESEKCRTCEELCEANPQWQLQDLAGHLHLSPATITKYLSPSRCIREVREALEAGRIGISACYEISRVPAEQQGELLRLTLSGTSRDGLAERVRRQKRESVLQARVKRIVCPLPSGVSVTVAGEKLSLDDLIESLGEAQKEAKKARDQGLDAKTFQSVMKDKSKKRGV